MMMGFLQLNNLGSPWLLAFLIICISPLLRFGLRKWRLSARLKKYPHIIICKGKDNSKTPWELTRNVAEIIFIIIGKFYHLLCHRNSIIESSAIETNDSHTAQSNNIRQEREKADKEVRHDYSKLSTFSPSSVFGSYQTKSEETPLNTTTRYYYDVLVQPEKILKLEDSAEGNSTPTQKLHHQLKIPKKRLGTPTLSTKRKFSSSVLPATMATTRSTTPLVLKKTSVILDHLSLSDQIKKKRSNGEAVSLHYNSVGSRKKRRLNCGRTSVLQGCVTTGKRPSHGSLFLRSSKLLQKRERVEREERLLRGMNCKRIKKSDTPTELKSTPVAVATPSSVKFGQVCPTKVPEGKQPTLAAVAPPSFSFGQTGSTEAPEDNVSASAHPSPSFTFGQAGPTKAPKEKASAPAPPPSHSINFGHTKPSEEKAVVPTISSAPKHPTASFQFGSNRNDNNMATAEKSNSTFSGNPNSQPPNFVTLADATKTSTPAITGMSSTYSQQQFGSSSLLTQNNQSSSTSNQSIASNLAKESKQFPLGFDGHTKHTTIAPPLSTIKEGNVFGGISQTSASIHEAVNSQGYELGTSTQAPSFGASSINQSFSQPNQASSQNQVGGTRQFNDVSAATTSQRAHSTNGNSFGASGMNQPYSLPTLAPAITLASAQNPFGSNNNNKEFGNSSIGFKPESQLNHTFGNTKENRNPGILNSTFQQPFLGANGNTSMHHIPSGLSKSTVGNVPSAPFGMNTKSNDVVGFSSGASNASGASARRQARKVRGRRR